MIQPSSNGSRVSYGRIPEMLPVADLIETQIRSFNRFKREGLRELFEEINPITDYTGKNYELKFLDYEFGQPKFDKEECRNRDMTFAAPLRINTRLTIRTGENAGEIKESEVFMGDFPIMTEEGTFIVNGTERVVVSQLVRSPGIYFTSSEDRASGRMLYAAKLIPNRGAWLEIETSGKDILTVKIDRKRKIPVTTLVRALGYGSNNEIKQLFADVDNNAEHKFIQSTLDKDSSTDVNDALVEMYKKIRPGDPPTVDNARALMTSLFFNPRRFDLSKVGRFKLNRRLGLGTDMNIRTLSNDDFIAIIRKLIELNNGTGEPDDIDHLGNRRVRAVGELLQNQFRMGLIRMERIIKERMTICDAAGRADPQAPSLGTRARWPVPGACRLRRPRRASFPLRPNLPDRDPRGSEHRTDGVPGDVCPGQRVRLHRDAVPPGVQRDAGGQGPSRQAGGSHAAR